ncbi:hypothetical protein [Desulfovibrio inopinatus]|uniref:hypothetical protein n=1 Tax=Desulfovibrio inopinatus TaxID=102109 RepID=UPI000417569E|nr:hypothetical protein [Desulfovibrio inopinatus]
MPSYDFPSFLVHAPALLPAFVSPAVQSCAQFFDPGLETTEQENMFRPLELPIEPKTFRQMVRDYDTLANQVSDPALLASIFGAPSNTSEESSRNILAALEGQASPDNEETKRQNERVAKAQLVLGLGVLLQKRHLELVELDSSFNQVKSKFENNLGMEQGDALGDATVIQSGFGEEHFDMPWATVLSAMLTLLPEEAGIFVSDPTVIDAWKDFGVQFGPLDDNIAMPAKCRVSGLQITRVPGYHLLLRKRPVEDVTLLNAERVVVIAS